MNPDPMRAPAQEAPEAELPQAPPGAEEGHDAVTPEPATVAGSDDHVAPADDHVAPADDHVAPAKSPLTPTQGPRTHAAGHMAPADGPVAPVKGFRTHAATPVGPEDPVAPEENPAVGAEDAVAPAEAFALAGEQLDALTAKAEKADEYLQLAQRTQADFENYRKRAAREARLAKERGATKLALDLLPAVDNLERALAHAPAGEQGEEGAFVSGIKHVHSDVVAALQRAGIERYSPEGERFDPTLHEAVAQQPVEGAEPGTVVEVFQRGYRMGDSIVRPARVVVAG